MKEFGNGHTNGVVDVQYIDRNGQDEQGNIVEIKASVSIAFGGGEQCWIIWSASSVLELRASCRQLRRRMVGPPGFGQAVVVMKGSISKGS